MAHHIRIRGWQHGEVALVTATTTDAPGEERDSEPADLGDPSVPAEPIDPGYTSGGSRVVGWCVFVCTIFGVAAWRHRWLHEDGLINLRIVDQVVLGNGPVFNVGERVEAFTSPAQIFVLSVARIATLGAVPIETLVFVVGVGAAVAGLACAMVGAARLWGQQGASTLRWLPAGAVLFAAVPFTWDYATSGHEGGLAYLWLGTSLLVLGTRVDRLRRGPFERIDRSRWALILLGSGALVRPELIVFSVAFLVCWWALHRDAPGSRLAAVGWASLLLIVSEILRMGYFGSLLPNTALAKLGGGSDVGRGLGYVMDFARPYALQLALPALIFVIFPVLRNARRPERYVVAAFEVPALLVVAQLVSNGGDYINGRLLVAPLFAVLAPFAVVPFAAIWSGTAGASGASDGSGAWVIARRVTVVALGVWAVLAMFVLRPPWEPRGQDILNPRLDAREMAIRAWSQGKRLTKVSDYRDTFLAGPYNSFVLTRDRTDGGLLYVDDAFTGDAVTLGPGQRSAIASGAVGALGVTAGPRLRIIDRTALADPVASRQAPVAETPGHLRYLPKPWIWARAGVTNDPASAAAGKAMTCGKLGQVMDSVTEPLTVGRFVSNILHAPSNTFVKVPADPEAAVDEFC